MANGASRFFNWLYRYARPDEAVRRPGALPRPAGQDFEDFSLAYMTDGVGNALTASGLQGILTNANEGYCRSQAAMGQVIVEREPLIAAHLGTRRLAVTGKPWTVTSEADEKRATEIQGMLKTAGLTKLLGHLLDAVPTGYSMAVLDWETGGRALRGWKSVHPSVIEFDQAGNPAVYDRLGKAHALAEWPATQFIQCYADGKPGLACRNGLLRALAWTYLFKHMGIKNWARFIEKFGIPFVFAEISDNDFRDATRKNALLASLKAIGAEGVAVGTINSKMQFLSGAEGGNQEAMEKFNRYCDEIYTLLILGQLATSEAGSGLSQGGMQEAVRQDLLAADALLLQDTVQRQIIEPLCRMRYGMPDAGDITFWIEYEEAEDLDKKATTWKTLTEVTGRKIDVAQVEDEFGVKFQEKEEPPPAFGGFGQPQPPPQADKLPLYDAAQRQTMALDAITQEAMRRTLDDPQVLAEWFGPVQTALRETFADLPADAGVDELRARIPALLKRLPGLVQEMDSQKFERHLSGAMLAAALNGYAAPGG